MNNQKRTLYLFKISNIFTNSIIKVELYLIYRIIQIRFAICVFLLIQITIVFLQLLFIEMKEIEDHSSLPSEDNNVNDGFQKPKIFQNNLIKKTRNFIKDFSEAQRMEMAKVHVNNALRYKEPRFDIINNADEHIFKNIYYFQTSAVWEMVMKILSFVHMYLIIFESSYDIRLYHLGSPIIYSIFILDFLMQTFHQSYDTVSKKARFSTLFFTKIIILTLLGIDQIFIGLNVQVHGRLIHPFRIFRVCLPILYNRQIRRSFESLGSTYKNIVLYFIFYCVIILIFALAGSKIIKQTIPPTSPRNNYRDLDKMIFIMYVCGTYDAYPDNQTAAVQQNFYTYGFFIVFIFLNMFIFSSIPGSMIFDKFRQTRGKLLLLDEIKMQNSLVVAFITLGQENYQMSIEKIIRFLLSFYEKRIRFIDVIANICLKLNPNDHTSIHINEFMQLGRILQQNSNLRPPVFSDWKYWIGFRSFIKKHINLKKIMTSNPYKLVNCFIIIAGVINAINLLFNKGEISGIFDYVFLNYFFAQLIVTFIAIGPENYFNQQFSFMDFTLVVGGFSLQFVDELTQQDALFRLFRIYKAGFLLQCIADNRFWRFQIPLYLRLKNLFLRMTVIIPLIMRFMPLFLLIYYGLGVLGMEIFYQASKMQASPSNIYDKYSNFRVFLDTQFYFVQVLTEAGWSAVAYDIAGRLSEIFSLVMVIFACFHLIIVLILATLLKGIVLSAFLTVSFQYEQKKRQESLQIQKSNKIKQKYDQLELFDTIVTNLQVLKLDSIVKRQIFESKSNNEIIQKLIKINKQKKLGRRSEKIDDNSLYRNFGINRNILEEEEEFNQIQKKTQYIYKLIEKFARQKIQGQPNNYDVFEYEKKMDKICKKLKINFDNDISLGIKPNQLLIEHLNTKLTTPCSHKNNNIHNQMASMQLFDMNILLGMHTTWREQKTLVIRSLVERNILDPEEANKLLHKNVGLKGFRLDEDCTIRKTYLQGTASKFIEKFQAEYFGHIYGKAFKQINKVTIEPLIKLQSTIVYAIKNIFRYPNISMHEFFRILTKIENKISNQLLKAGSLFKLVFKLNSQKNIWFSIKFEGTKPKLSFLKHGIWIYHEKIEEHEIYYAKDLFKYEKDFLKGDILERANVIESLFSTFQSLALTLQEKEIFFKSNPKFHIYDTYFTCLNAEPIQRLIQKELEISKIMVVLLTKEKQRTFNQEIPFNVSQIPIQKFQPEVQFKLDQTQNQTYKKLCHLAQMNDQQATANEGLPFSNVLSFLQQINDILKLHSPNLIYHIQNLLNIEFKKPENNIEMKYSDP